MGASVSMAKMVIDGDCEGYCLPQGVICQLWREIAAKRPGVITKIGLKTFVDPRLEGGKMNKRNPGIEKPLACISGQLSVNPVKHYKADVLANVGQIGNCSKLYKIGMMATLRQCFANISNWTKHYKTDMLANVGQVATHFKCYETRMFVNAGRCCCHGANCQNAIKQTCWPMLANFNGRDAS